MRRDYLPISQYFGYLFTVTMETPKTIWDLFEVNNKDIKKTSLTSLYCLYC